MACVVSRADNDEERFERQRKRETPMKSERARTATMSRDRRDRIASHTKNVIETKG